MTEPRSQLAPFAHLYRDANPEKAWEIAKQAWHDHGMLILILPEVDKRAGFVAARTARNLGDQVFGKRKGTS